MMSKQLLLPIIACITLTGQTIKVDLPGYQETRWGMAIQEVKGKSKIDLTAHDGINNTVLLNGKVQVEGKTTDIIYSFSGDDSHTLESVTLNYYGKSLKDHVNQFKALQQALSHKYGKPSTSTKSAYFWIFNTTTIWLNLWKENVQIIYSPTTVAEDNL